MRTPVASALIEPGFFTSNTVQTALLVGGVVAFVSAVVGVFTVVRGQSFAGHSLADVGATGGSGAFLIAVSPLWGFLALSVAGAAAMELIGIQRRRGRDLATGIVLGASLGLAALFLYLDTTVHSNTGAAQSVLFGSMFSINRATVPVIVGFAVSCVAVIAALYRPLLLAAVSPDIATARGVRVRLVGLLYLLTLAVAVALSSIAIGSILSTALLIGPAATALKISARPLTAVALAALTGVAATGVGVLLAYDSYYWPPVRHGWPVSFFIVTLIFLTYLVADLATARSPRSSVRARPLDLVGG